MSDVFELEDHENDRVYDSAPPVKRSGDWVERMRTEMDNYYELMKKFGSYQLDDIYLSLAGWTARVSELRGQLNRSNTALTKKLVALEIDPFLKECDRQFQFHSRRQSVYQTEVTMSGKVT